MKRQMRQLCASVVGALFLVSGIALGQDSLSQPSQMQPPRGRMSDTMQTQGSRYDTLQMPRSNPDTIHGSRSDSSRAGTRDSTQGSSTGTLAPDNTGINKRDRSDSEVTADEQGQSPADIDMTQKIRHAIVDDDSLSTYAKNIKIITKDGMVTLKGPVRSEQEKSTIEAKAAAVAGAEKVKSQIEVKTADTPKND